MLYSYLDVKDIALPEQTKKISAFLTSSGIIILSNYLKFTISKSLKISSL